MKINLFRNRKDAPSAVASQDRVLRRWVWAFAGMLFLFALAAAGSFLLTLQGPEQTQVPNAQGAELVDAVISLQERGLSPYVQLRYDSDPSLKGRVIGQSPEPGAVVRAGRQIVLTVSQGAVVDAVGDYVGIQLVDVQAELQALGSGGDGLLFIDAVSYVFDEAPSGTVLGQAPEAGANITGSTGVDLVVSRGPEVERIAVPTFIGLDWGDALEVLARDSIPFVFGLEEQPSVGQDGAVVAQDPVPGSEVEPDEAIRLTIRSTRSVSENERFGIFDRVLPDYAVSVELSVVIVGPEGESRTYFDMVHPGGRFSFPYVLPYGSTIIVYRYDDEVIRETIQAPQTEDS